MTTNAQRFKNYLGPKEGAPIPDELFSETVDLFFQELKGTLAAENQAETVKLLVLTFKDSSGLLLLGVDGGLEPRHPQGYYAIEVRDTFVELAPVYAELAVKYNLEIQRHD